MKKEKEIKQFDEMPEDEPIKVGIEASRIADRKIKEFIQDMRELGQTNVAACGPGYKISFEIDLKETQ